MGGSGASWSVRALVGRVGAAGLGQSGLLDEPAHDAVPVSVGGPTTPTPAPLPATGPPFRHLELPACVAVDPGTAAATGCTPRTSPFPFLPPPPA